MKKHKPMKLPKSQKDLAKQLKRLGNHMIDLGVSMDFYGGFNADMVSRGITLVNLGMRTRNWAEDMKR